MIVLWFVTLAVIFVRLIKTKILFDSLSLMLKSANTTKLYSIGASKSSVTTLASFSCYLASR